MLRENKEKKVQESFFNQANIPEAESPITDPVWIPNYSHFLRNSEKHGK